MRIVERLPRAVRSIEHCWIPLPDGTRLGARLWMPEDATRAPVPAVLEYLPYRKRDFTRARDEPMHHYLAGHGYACVRVDIRGTGDSEGILTDEYSSAEHDDAVAVIDWIAAQRWCSGAVGMTGISWGGFNALQVAARRPPALRAVISLCASDDRYADDAHFMGGCLLNENLTWGAVLLQLCAYPPDPDVVGPGWRTRWLDRLARVPSFAALWLRHQRRDAYWRHGSVCEDYGAVACPVYAIGGWADGYANAVFRLLAGLHGPRKGLVGPWAHLFPHLGTPGPAIGYLQEAVRWWDHWLKGVDTGIMDEPMLRVWMQESVPPRPFHTVRPGRWVSEATWPSPRIVRRRWAVNTGSLETEPASGRPIAHQSLQTAGLGAGDWCAFGAEGEMPTDQRRDDGVSLTFDSEALETPLEVLGSPVVELQVAVDRPQAFLAVRLNDVAPDGASLRVSYGLLNLAHRGGHAHPDALRPGVACRVHVRLNDVAHVFPAGHRLRLAVSTSYWPIVWPSPEPVTLTVFPGEGRLELPVRPPDPADADLRPFDPPEQAPELTRVQLRPGQFRRTYERDLATNETVYTVFSDDAEGEGASLAHVPAIDLDLGYSLLRRYRIGERDPCVATAEVVQETLFRRGAWSVRIRSRVALEATREAFRVRTSLIAHEGDTCTTSRAWDDTIPRDHV